MGQPKPAQHIGYHEYSHSKARGGCGVFRRRERTTVPGKHPTGKEGGRYQARGNDPEVGRLVDHRVAVPALFNGHGRDRDNECQKSGHGDIRPAKRTLVLVTAAVVLAGRLVAEFLLVHARVSHDVPSVAITR